jgi:hypothetical protein
MWFRFLTRSGWELLLNFSKGEGRSMKQVKYVTLLSMLALLLSVSALARDKSQHSVVISDSVQVGSTQLKPGSYKVEWQGTGPEIQVNFVRDGKTVATVPGTLKTNDAKVTQDEIVTDTTSANTKTLAEIDFGRNKESLVFGQSGM